MNKKNKILSSIFLAVLVLPLICISYFLVKQQFIQYQMEEKLETASLKTIELNTNEIIWVKANKEIIINGAMFDVKSYQIKNDKIILTGLYDTDEKKLKDEYLNCLNQKKGSSTPLHKLLIKFIFTSALLNDSSTAIQFNGFIKSLFYNYSEVIFSNTIAVLSPPPNVWFYCNKTT